jgi:hypothetical protein
VKYKIVEEPMPPQDKTLENIEAAILAHLNELNKAGSPTFDECLACYQALVQIRQTYLLQGVFDMLKHWYQNGVPVYPMAT